MKKDPYLKIWELDLISREKKDKYCKLINHEYQKAIEKEITSYLQRNFSFCVFRVDDKKERIELEESLISTISSCKECKPSPNWLGLESPLEKIRTSGLWNVQGLFKESSVIMKSEDLKKLSNILKYN